MGSPPPAAAIAIRPMSEADWPAVAGIYAEGIATGDATFETAVPAHASRHAASPALHKRAGFRVVGTRERLGLLAGRWRDVVWLERRSERVGVAAPTTAPAASVSLDVGRG
jgi:phosphinothricin acetyltransferase